MSSPTPHQVHPPTLQQAQLNRDKHVKYWLRCLKSPLPHHYISSDSNRMSIAFFIYSALDLLGALESSVSASERQDHIDWIYHCQLPEGAFRAFPGSDFGKLRNDQNKKWDPPNLPATFFALQTLAVLKDDLRRLNTRGILEWLPKLQRDDGSFGQMVMNNIIEGGHDSRFGYMVAGVRWMLRGNKEGPLAGIPDVDIDQFERCIQLSQTYDGGISEAPFHEAHAGFEFCAISALSLFGRLPGSVTTSTTPMPKTAALTQLDEIVHWLVSRQTATLDEEDEFDTNSDETDTPKTCHDSHSFVKLSSFPSKMGEIAYASRPTSNFELQWLGFNGRCNKIADTCYAWWVCGTLSILNKQQLVDIKASRKYLLDKTQHMIGGFGKMPGDPPDVYHSYLGLAVLSLHGESELKDFDPALCITKDAKRHLESLSSRQAIIDGTTDSLPPLSNSSSQETQGSTASTASSTPGYIAEKYSHLSITGG
ncbi:MAG: hypothetical protein M1820_008433 [Bogoriella megaspora]|nr:MAG: hypothetical protein M1820_008433 [Bogoriella megaspora]